MTIYPELVLYHIKIVIIIHIMNKISCFKAYDIRGQVPDELNEELAYLIGCCFAKIINPGTVVVGYDVRLESLRLTNSLTKGLTDCGVDVINIGLCGTEEVYFNTFHREKEGIGGGIMVTASHNPKGYNGMKMVKSGSRPISSDTDLKSIHDLIVSIQNDQIQLNSLLSSRQGTIRSAEDKAEYIAHLLSYIDIDKVKPIKIVVNPGNGPAGIIIKSLEKHLPFEFIYLHEQPDGNFPNGVPNPMIEANRVSTSKAVIEYDADLGIAWDGDFDRCFLFDEKGQFIEGYYIVGLLAESFLNKFSGEKIIHDPRLVWNTKDIVKKSGGIALQSKSGHSFIKEKMRQENALYGGEMSAHHYFREFGYCDSGMLPWLLISELISGHTKTKLSKLVLDRMLAYPCSGEINYKVKDVTTTILQVEKYFKTQNPSIDYTDGISIEFTDWRFNLRGSNTEPLLRLNLETKSQSISIKEKVAEIEHIIYKT